MLEHRELVYNLAVPRFIYFESEHPDLIGKMHTLENEGRIIDVTHPESYTPRYRMTERFVELVLAS